MYFYDSQFSLWHVWNDGILKDLYHIIRYTYDNITLTTCYNFSGCHTGRHHELSKAEVQLKRHSKGLRRWRATAFHECRFKLLWIRQLKERYISLRLVIEPVTHSQIEAPSLSLIGTALVVISMDLSVFGFWIRSHIDSSWYSHQMFAFMMWFHPMGGMLAWIFR